MDDTHTSVQDSQQTTSLPRVVTDFAGDYKPPFDVVKCVEAMLRSVPEKYLVGLSEVVLTNTAGLPRKMRRAMTLSRGKKVRQASALGLYHQAWKNRPAWIQLYVDNILCGWEGGFWLRFRLLREGFISDVLFHEIGHHIHDAIRPEHREQEDVADVWKVRLSRNYLKTVHPTIRFFMKLVRLVFGPLWTLLWKKSLSLQRKKGYISNAEYQEEMRIRNK
jgi:hypothetical protein